MAVVRSRDLQGQEGDGKDFEGAGRLKATCVTSSRSGCDGRKRLRWLEKTKAENVQKLTLRV